jgi:hypothetical protein
MVGKELCKVQFMEAFEDSCYDLEQKNIILDSIRVATLDDDKHFKKNIPFEIQVAGENGFRIRPCFSKGKFLIMYEYVVEAYKVTIPANAFPYHMNENGDFEICIPSEENK